ncbi:hypothetical protein TNCV_2379771 [Trichonephila clavipes]|uniref:Uncharacterized protein n=1 Tax=Trichonephila clavipes TaxID=2585209 RepID=A0A8X6V6G8_TRICX|nr:hypothetical protein TNCV_2379771 [Trichonephila clavipes]
MPNNHTTCPFMTAVDFLHHESPPTMAGVEPATLGADGQQQTNYATQTAKAEISATRSPLATDLIILNHGQVTRTVPELAPPLPSTTPTVGRLSSRQINVHSHPYTAGL